MKKQTMVKLIRNRIKNGVGYDDIYEAHAHQCYQGQFLTINDPHTRFIILDYFFKTNDRHIFNFAQSNTDASFDLKRYLEYRAYRNVNLYDSGSDTYFKLLYGPSWEIIKRNRSATRFNPYSIDDHVDAGLSIEEATIKVNQLKASTAPSREKYVEKYGEIGNEMFENHCRIHRNYLDWWVEECDGNIDEAISKFTEYTRKTNSCTVDHYLAKGYTLDESKRMVSERQLMYAGVHRSYWEQFDLTPDEIDNTMEDMNRKKDSSSLQYLLSKYEDLPRDEVLQIYIDANRYKSSTFREHGYLLKDDPTLSARVKYYAEVNYYTRLNIPHMGPCPGNRGKRVNEYHVDHKYSRNQGFINNVPAHIIGHHTNLEWVISSVNCAKKDKCSITITQLYEGYNKHESNKN